MQAEELTGTPFATLKPDGGGGQEGGPAGCVGSKPPSLSDVHPTTSAPGGLPGAPWRGRGGQPHLTSWGPLSSRLCQRPRALSQPPLPKLGQEGECRGAEGPAATWRGLGPAQGGGGERERKGSFSPEPPPPLLPSAGSQPSPLPPPRPVRGGCRGVPGAPVSLELESSPSFIIPPKMRMWGYHSYQKSTSGHLQMSHRVLITVVETCVAPFSVEDI